MDEALESYLFSFSPLCDLSRQSLIDELDRVWLDLGLDNRKSLKSQSSLVSLFYSHPVWILNGLFSEVDADSKMHRESIARYIIETGAKNIADYGGGSGFLAKIITQSSGVRVDIVEPYPSSFFVNRLSEIENIKFLGYLHPGYDAIIAQDVLEHVDNPIGVALKLVNATQYGGLLIFANCFEPVIKCHLPATFYLRHTFAALMYCAGLSFVGRVNGAEHAMVFKRVRPVNTVALSFALPISMLLGSIINKNINVLIHLKRTMKFFL